jgi:site-specific recombinase XerD
MGRPAQPEARTVPVTLPRLAVSWRLSLNAANKSPRTIETYLASLDLFIAWLETNGRPDTVQDVTRADVEGFIADQLARHKPATVSVRYRSLRTFFNWLVREDEIDRSPMATMTPPIVPEQPVPVLTDDEMRKLLKVCAGKDFEDRRDNAVLRLLYDTGVRRAEIAGLTVDDVDLELRVIRVLGKGRRPRSVPFGHATAKAVDRWLRARDGHVQAKTSPMLWLGTQGRGFNDQALRQMLERRGEQAGVAGVHAHRFRHSFAHSYLADGGQESDLMMLTGWRSREMLNRYASSTAAERARANYRSPGDRL